MSKPNKKIAMKVTLFVLTTIIFSAASGLEDGLDISRNKYKFLVSIRVDDSHKCGGFIYSDRWIVTSAKCVEQYENNPSQVKIVVGENSIPDDGEVGEAIYSVLRIILQDDYSSTTLTNDIALIETSRDIADLGGVYAAAIPYNEVNEDQIDGTLMGWGKCANDTEEYYDTPQETVGTIEQPPTLCIDAYQPNFDSRSMLCISDARTCLYDQGGPLVQLDSKGDLIVVGIMSKNKGINSPEAPTIYTRLSVYYAWFIRNAGLQTVPNL